MYKKYLWWLTLPMMASAQTSIDCFKEALPYMFGSDVGETHFTAITNDEEGHSSNGGDINLYIGGDTTNSFLHGESTEYAMTDKRPFVMRYRARFNSMTDSNVNDMRGYSYFRDTSLREVFAIYYRKDSSKQYVLVLIGSATDATYLYTLGTSLGHKEDRKIVYTADGGTT